MPRFSWRHRLLLILFAVAGYFTAGNAAHLIRVLWQGSNVPDAYFPVRLATREFGSRPYFRWEVLTIDGKPFSRGDDIREAIEARRPGDRIPVTMKNLAGEVKTIQIKVGSVIPA